MAKESNSLKRPAASDSRSLEAHNEETIASFSNPPAPKKLRLDSQEILDVTDSTCSRSTDDSLPNFKDIKLHNAPVHYCKAEHGLNVDYFHQLFSKNDADKIFHLLCTQLASFLEQSENKVQIFGKTHTIPRKQAAFGDDGLSYSFSGVTVRAHPWLPFLRVIKECVESVLVSETFNFVLVNRYKDGSDHIGEHRDDEKDLVDGASIAGLSFGQQRDFILKHKHSRGKNGKRKDIQLIKISLGHGSLVVLKHPTNSMWYHSVPPRKGVDGVRISLTFRRMKV